MTSNLLRLTAVNLPLKSVCDVNPATSEHQRALSRTNLKLPTPHREPVTPSEYHGLPANATTDVWSLRIALSLPMTSAKFSNLSRLPQYIYEHNYSLQR